jgi:DNA polymerase V
MYALVDCNSFYCSCERVFKPALLTQPVVVLSNNDGCVISRTNEAKALGIAMGAPAHHIKDIVEKHKVAVFSSNYTLYGDMSARVMSVLGQFSPEMEIYSIDEAFLNLTGFEHFDLPVYGKTIVKTTQQSTGIPVSIGIAATKTLAKLANKLAKKIPENKGVCVIETAFEVRNALKMFPIEDVWGIGRQHAKRLEAMRIQTAFDFTQLPREWVQKNMTVVGVRTWEELRGKPCIELELVAPTKKNICTSRSFGQLLTDFNEIEEAIANHAASCGEKLRRQKSCAGIMTIFIATNPFQTKTPQYANSISLHLPQSTNDSGALIHAAKMGFKQIFKKGYLYKKAGIIVCELTPETTQQTDLFRPIETDEKHRKLMHVLDGLNREFGKNMVKIAAQGNNKRWRLKQEKLSAHYTTKLKEIFVISV